MESILINSRQVAKFGKDGIEKEYEFYNDSHSGLLRVEENALLVMELLNIYRFERTRDLIQLNYEYETVDEVDNEVTIFITDEEIQFRINVIEWTKGSYAPVGTSKKWKSISTNELREEKLKEKILELFKGSLKAIEDRLITCKYCNKKVERGHAIDKETCQHCAVVHLGVVF